MYKNPKDIPWLLNRGVYFHVKCTSAHSSGGWSWIKLWTKATGLNKPSTCSFTGCDGQAQYGCHVAHCNATNNYHSWYIVPGCAYCNKRHGLARGLKKDSILVRVMHGHIFKANTIEWGVLDNHRFQELRGACMEVRYGNHEAWVNNYLDKKEKGLTRTEIASSLQCFKPSHWGPR